MSLTTRYGFADAPTSAIIGNGSLAWTTSTGALSAAGTSLTVLSSAAFPAALEFDVIIGVRDPTTNEWATAEIRHVTVVSGTTWTVSAGSLDHVSGSDISHVLTASGLQHNPGALTDTGDLPYLLSTGRMGRLAAPANGTYNLTWASGVPSWTAASSGISYADLATPPTNTALGAVATPFGALFTSGVATLDSVPVLSFAPTFAAEPVSYVNYVLSDWTFTRTASGVTNADIAAGAYVFGGEFAGGDYLTGGDGLVLMDIDATLSGDASAAYVVGTSVRANANDTSQATQLFGYQGRATVRDTATVTLAIGSQGDVELQGGHVTTAAGMESLLSLQSSAIADTAIGLWSNFDTFSSATGATVAYGLKIEPVAYGLTNYAIWTSGTAPSVFGGTVTATDFIVSGSRFKSDTVDTHTGGLAVYDVNGAAYRDFLVWTNANAPAVVMSIPTTGTLAIDASTLTLNSVAVATQAYVNAQGFVTASSATAFTNKTGAISQWTNDSSFTTLAAVAGVGYVPGTRTVNGHALSSNVTVTASDLSLGSVENAAASGLYVPLTRTVNGHALSGNISVTASDLSLGSVENTALSTWAGSTNLTTLGTIATGTWSGTAIAANKGGTGQTVYVVGDLLQASTTTALSMLAGVATGNALISGGVGTVSAWGKVGLTTHVSGILPTANGGTGIAFFTAAGPTQARIYTFPDAAATIARTDAANTFTGHQTIEGVTSTGATGTGKFVFDGSPTLVTPVLGVATATSLNGNTFTTGTYTLTGQAGKTLTFNGSITLTGTDAQTYTFPTTSATIARTDAANTFTGVQTMTNPALSGGTLTALTSLGVRDTSAAFDVTVAATSSATLTAGRTLTLDLANVAHTLALGTTAGTITFPNTAAMTVARTDTGQTFTGSNTFGSSVVTNGSFNGNQASSTLVLGNASQAGLAYDAAYTFGIRNGTNPHNVRFYNTFTTLTTAGEWFKHDWKTTANQFRMGSVMGTVSGTARVASWDYGGLEASPSAAITVPITSGNIVFGGGVQLSNAAVTGLAGGVLAATTNASIVLYDSNGQAYRVPCII